MNMRLLENIQVTHLQETISQLYDEFRKGRN